MKLGAACFVSPADQETVNTLAEKFHIKRVIECVGVRPAQKTALTVADKGATVVMFGVSDAADELPINLYDAFLKELTIKTSFVNPFTTQRAINILNSGALDADKIICKDLTMEEAIEEFANPTYSRMGKVIVTVKPE